jgi:hypothetical protein
MSVLHHHAEGCPPVVPASPADECGHVFGGVGPPGRDALGDFDAGELGELAHPSLSGGEVPDGGDHHFVLLDARRADRLPSVDVGGTMPEIPRDRQIVEVGSAGLVPQERPQAGEQHRVEHHRFFVEIPQVSIPLEELRQRDRFHRLPLSLDAWTGVHYTTIR